VHGRLSVIGGRHVQRSRQPPPWMRPSPHAIVFLAGLALYALERTYPVGGGMGTGRHAFNLNSSPFCSSKAKHAAIGNAARKILQNLDLYVHEVGGCMRRTASLHVYH